MPDGIKNNRIRHITKGKESNLKNIIIMKEPFRDYGCFENKNNERIVCFNITKSYLQSGDPICMSVQENIGDSTEDVQRKLI